MSDGPGANWTCRTCGVLNAASAIYCPSCGAPSVPSGEQGSDSPPLAPEPSTRWGRQPAAATFGGGVEYDPQGVERERTRSGLLLLTISAGVSWIPYVNLVGGLLGLIAVVLLFLGRRGYGPGHRRYVVYGASLIAIGLVGAVAVGIGLAVSVLSAVNSSGSLSDAGATLRADLIAVAIAGVVLGFLNAVGQLLLGYRLADRAARQLLIVGTVLSLVFSTIVLAYALTLLGPAISQATSGTTFDVGPINAVENTIRLYQATSVVPALILAYAFYSIREALRTRSPTVSQ